MTQSGTNLEAHDANASAKIGNPTPFRVAQATSAARIAASLRWTVLLFMGDAPDRPIHRIERDSPLLNKKRKEAQRGGCLGEGEIVLQDVSGERHLFHFETFFQPLRGADPRGMAAAGTCRHGLPLKQSLPRLLYLVPSPRM
jgi:hypothetical protein